MIFNETIQPPDQNGQKLHENNEISILGSKQWGDMGGNKPIFGVVGRSPQSLPPLRETLPDKSECVAGQIWSYLPNTISSWRDCPPIEVIGGTDSGNKKFVTGSLPYRNS